MPRRKVEFWAGEYYHIYNRGCGRESIFREEKNYFYLLDLIKKVSSETEMTVITYCLLPNHYHWLIRQDGQTPVTILPQRVFGSYTQAFNKMYHHTGTLFEGRFHAKHVDSDAYLRQLCLYIHFNPVKHGLVTKVEDWPYSNYLEWIDKRHGRLIDRAFVNALFPKPNAYAQSFREAPSFPEANGLLPSY